MIYSALAVFIGSGIGGLFRWALGCWLNGTHPIGTLAANIAGCFILGLLTRLAPGDANLRLLLMTGFCGGFTTFSTFVNENFLLLRSGELIQSVAYMAISLLLGLMAAWAGYQTATHWLN